MGNAPSFLDKWFLCVDLPLKDLSVLEIQLWIDYTITVVMSLDKPYLLSKWDNESESGEQEP
jgi:hypothetical protein